MTRVLRGAGWALLLLSLLASRADGAFSFLLLPLPTSTSHCLEMMGIGRALQERGHTVHLLVPDFAEVNKCVPKDLRAKINVITFRTDPETSTFITSYVKNATYIMASGEGGSAHMFSTLQTLIPLICQTYVGTRPILDQFLASKGGARKKPDMVLIDGVPFGRCLILVPAYLDTRLALTGSFMNPYDSGSPWPVTFYPLPITDLPGRMTFIQRLINTLSFTFLQVMVLVIDSLYRQGNDFGEGLAGFDYGTAAKRADLYLENSDYILDCAKATFPNFVQVGGLTTGPAQALPEDLQQFFDLSKDGVVVISFGSMLYNTSRELTDKLLTAAAKVKLNVVLRLGVDRATVPVPQHVKVVSWFPQNDALGHVNTRLFVYHCGKNGVFESLYHAVPILCIPLNGDGFGSAKRVADFGVGGSVDLKSVTAEDLGLMINGIVEDAQIRQRMKFYSSLFHQRPETPGHRAASALEHVIQHGGDHLRPQTVDLNFVQYTGLDVLCVLMGVVGTVVGVVGWGCGIVFCWLFRRLSRSVTKGWTDKATKTE